MPTTVPGWYIVVLKYVPTRITETKLSLFQLLLLRIRQKTCKRRMGHFTKCEDENVWVYISLLKLNRIQLPS